MQLHEQRHPQTPMNREGERPRQLGCDDKGPQFFFSMSANLDVRPVFGVTLKEICKTPNAQCPRLVRHDVRDPLQAKGTEAPWRDTSERGSGVRNHNKIGAILLALF